MLRRVFGRVSLKETLSYLLSTIAVLTIVLLAGAACDKKESKAPAEKVINVRVQSAETKSLRPFIESIGSLSPQEEVMISAEVDGIVREVHVAEGSSVSKGKPLAAIDDTDYRLDVTRAEAALKQAEATFKNTQLEFGRKQSLFREELVTKQQFDDVATRLSLAEADVDKSKASLALAQQKLSKTHIYAPLSGMVKEKKLERGNYVRNGSHLYTIILTNPLKLIFTVPEKDVAKLRTGQEVLFRVDAFPGREFSGTVNILYPNVDDKTRTLQVEARVPNTEGLLKPGLFAKVILYTDAARSTIVVPVTSLLYEGEKVKVFVEENGRAKERQVKVGDKYGEFMAILDGVKEKEHVVVVGQQNLSEGVKVNVAR